MRQRIQDPRFRSVGSIGDIGLSINESSLLSPVAESLKKGSSQIFRDFMARTDSRPMPDLDRTSWCQSTRIYWFMSKQDDFGETAIEQGLRSMNLAES